MSARRTTLCARCKDAEKLKGQSYCGPCKTEVNRVTQRLRRGGTPVGYRRHPERCNCGNPLCSGLECERASQ